MIANGRFNVNLLRAGGLRDEDFRRAVREGFILDLLASLEVELNCPKRKNLANHGFPQYIFAKIMSGGSVNNPYNRNGVGSGGLASVHLSNYDSEPGYTDGGETYTTYNGIPGVTGSSAKLFIDNHIEDHRLIVWADAHENRFEVFAKESILFRDRWLWLPSQGISNDIRSLQYNYAHDANVTGSSYRGPFGRIRLRDERGRTVIVNKTADHVLFAELELELVTV